MHTLRTAVLEHTTAHGVHHDWLIEDPALNHPQAPDARLWTARVSLPPASWPAMKRFELEVIAPHRRAYLSYQGPIAHGRGRVRRVAQSSCNARLWTDGRVVFDTALPGIDATIELRRIAHEHWLGIMI